MWNIDKGMMLTASKRIDKSPTPRADRGFLFFPTAGTDKMTNTRQMPQLQQSYKIHKRDGFHPQMTLINPFTLENYPLWDYFATNNFQINEFKAVWHFNNLLELHYPASKGYIFAAWAGVESSQSQKCSLYSQGRVAFAMTRFITFQRLRFYNSLAYGD